MDGTKSEHHFATLAEFVRDECERRLRAYEAQPRDAAEHFETENDVLSGGYAYRQLYELVQNAADAVIEADDDQGRIHIRLTADVLEAANTGAPLDKEGIVALLNSRSSSKRGDQIGRFGIGFKSLLKLGGQIDLISSSIGLRFDPDACRKRIRHHLNLPDDERAPGMRLAEVLHPYGPNSPLSNTERYHWAETVVSAKITDPSISRRIANEIEVFPPEFLLFLPTDIKLDLEIEGTGTRQISKRIENGVSVVSDGSSETRWKVFEKRVSIQTLEARSDATHIQARDDIPLTWAVPLSGREQAGRFWAFFPTETHTLTSGILNAPWKLNSDRTNLIRGPWNEAIMEAAAALIANSLPALATKEDYGTPVSAFPRQPDRLDEIAVPLVKSLWKRILDSRVLPTADGIIRKPIEVKRHFIENADICAQWSELASPSTRSLFLHPDTYRYQIRSSRIRALQDEAIRRNMTVLQKVQADEWLEPLADTDTGHAKRVLMFVGGLLSQRRKYQFYDVPDVPLIPSIGGALAAPSEAMITSGANAPPGYVAVSDEISGDPACRRILVNCFDVRVFSEESWKDHLDTCLHTAKYSSDPQDWDRFWRGVAAAPKRVIDSFIASLDNDCDALKFRTLSGSWAKRNVLVVVGNDTRVPDDFVLDSDYISDLALNLPEDWLSKFPTGIESMSTIPSELDAYGDWVGTPFKTICQQKVDRKPLYNPDIQGYYDLKFHAGWRLLPHLPPGLAARLTLQIMERVNNLAPGARPVTLGHPTRADAYPKVTAPHPMLFWLTKNGRILIGKWVIPVKAMQPNLASILATADLPGFDTISAFFAMRDVETELGSQLKWTRTKLSKDEYEKIWNTIFEKVETNQHSFDRLHKLWDVAHTMGAIPSRVPTSGGPLPLTEIFVTTDPSIGNDFDDGRIVFLSPACARGWIEVGAQILPETTVCFRKRLSEPAHLLDLFPELTISSKLRNCLRELIGVWVEELEEDIGPVKRQMTIAMDTDGAVFLDRARFEARDWSDGITLLLRCLERHNVLPEDNDFDDLLSTILDRRSVEARGRVRKQATLAGRLLEAVGGNTETLLSTMTPATRRALGNDVLPLDVAELTLAVHGPAVLSRLRDALDAQGLTPPKRWGGEPARAFVLDLGFPLEFASTVGGRREAELSVSGPISLPLLHDFQRGILTDIENLLSSGNSRRRAVISLPTGGGKTRVAAEAIVRLVLLGDRRRSVLWVAQTDELCEQAVQCFRQLWVNIGKTGEDLRIVRLWGGQRSPSPSDSDEAVVVVASIQTLNSRSGRAELAWVSDAGIIVIDECHHAIASSYTELLRWLDLQVGTERSRDREPPLLGLSATPWRGYNEEESERLAGRFDRRWFPADQSGLHDRLSAMGVLAERSYQPLRYDRPVELTPREQQHVETFGELPDSVVDRIGNDKDRNELVVRAVQQSDAKSILLFANSVAHAQYLAARLHLAGCPAASVSGQTNRLARRHFTQKFRSETLRVICNHSVLTTGFDAPKSDMILISRPVFSPVLYMQMVGRGLRGPKNGGTPHCAIVTVEDNIVNFRDRLAYHFCKRFFGP